MSLDFRFLNIFALSIYPYYDARHFRDGRRGFLPR